LEWIIVRQVAAKGGQLQPVIVQNRDILLILRAEIDKAGSVAAWCKQTGVNRTYLSQVLNKRRAAGAKLLSILNLSAVLVHGTKSTAVSKRGLKIRPSGKREPRSCP
jgi:hypothetical protein